MEIFKQLILIGILSLFSIAGFSQIPSNRRQSGIDSRSGMSRRAEIFPFRAKRSKDQEKRLKPNQIDLEKHKDFLRQSKTGIFRLLNDAGCEANLYVVRVDDQCRNSIPDSAFYSFRERQHTTSHLSDLRMKDGILISDGMLSQNILVRLGDVQLENLTLETRGMGYLTGFVPEIDSRMATEQFIQIVRGVKTGGYEYRKALPAVANMTYAIRIVAYRGAIYRNFRGWLYNLLDGDERVDLTVGFRIIRKDDDSGITILWRELDRKKSPKLKIEKRKEPKRLNNNDLPSKTMAEIDK